MPNIIDYIDWRGDISLENSKFNELDNMIMSRISYLPFEEIKMTEIETIKTISKKFKKVKEEKFNIKDDKKLIEKIGNSNRFKNLLITDYYSSTNYSEEKQFIAITIHLNDKEIYISYGGTDNTLIGWKEDFNLSFMTHIPSQIEGLKYIKNIAKKYEEKIHLGGHSKGRKYSRIFSNICISNNTKKNNRCNKSRWTRF